MEKSIAILGAGSWGATQAWLFGRAGINVRLWMRNKEKAEELKQKRVIEKPLTIALPDQVEVTADLEEATNEAQIILFAVTTQSTREVAKNLRPILEARQLKKSQSPIIVSTSKGLELKTFERVSQILTDVFTGIVPPEQISVMSGPNLAGEILLGLPTASAISCAQEQTAMHVQEMLTTKTFRLYTNTDMVGVEIGGALKNILAIASGTSDGLNLGINARSTLLTRGLAEITRFAEKLGARAQTLAGLAGMGDLIATCSSPLSRNYRLGYYLAEGLSVDEALGKLGATAEGMPTCFAVCEMAETQHFDLEMPIANQVREALTGKITPKQSIVNLMNRPLIKEH